MPKSRILLIAAAACIAGAAGARYFPSRTVAPIAYAQSIPAHTLPSPTSGGVVIELCDGVTHTEVKGLKPGEPMSREEALAVTGRLMAEWRRKHPGVPWQMAENDQPSAMAAASGAAKSAASPASPPKLQQGDTYASFHERDYKIWKAQTDAFVAYGDQVFHSAKLLGSTIGVSCDMCHPNAANTHPETYPKYQEQLQRVALLRDMIDWCIENPVRGASLQPNDPKMRALEAYILAQRKGVPLDYGKH
jgi:thiosulfate dehydrogenase